MEFKNIYKNTKMLALNKLKFTISGIYSDTTNHTRKQENTTYNKNNQLIENELEIIHM